MSDPDYKIIVGVYLRGRDLDPAVVSRELGLTPSSSHDRGERRITSTQREFVTKIELWAITLDLASGHLGDHLEQVLSTFPAGAETLTQISGVEEAYLDIFMATNADNEIKGTCVSFN